MGSSRAQGSALPNAHAFKRPPANPAPSVSNDFQDIHHFLVESPKDKGR
jgi:hypothetical protein